MRALHSTEGTLDRISTSEELHQAFDVINGVDSSPNTEWFETGRAANCSPSDAWEDSGDLWDEMTANQQFQVAADMEPLIALFLERRETVN